MRINLITGSRPVVQLRSDSSIPLSLVVHAVVITHLLRTAILHVTTVIRIHWQNTQYTVTRIRFCGCTRRGADEVLGHYNVNVFFANNVTLV